MLVLHQLQKVVEAELRVRQIFDCSHGYAKPNESGVVANVCTQFQNTSDSRNVFYNGPRIYEYGNYGYYGYVDI